MIISSGEGTSNRNGFKRLLLAMYSFLSGEVGIDFRLFEALVLFSFHCLHNTCANGDGPRESKIAGDASQAHWRRCTTAYSTQFRLGGR